MSERENDDDHRKNTKEDIRVIHTNSFAIDVDVSVEKRHRLAG